MKNSIKINVIAALLFALSSFTTACTTEDPVYQIEQFTTDMAQAYCLWIYGDSASQSPACCDSEEQKQQLGGGSYSQCLSDMQQELSASLANIDPTLWRGNVAKACAATAVENALVCQRNYDLSFYKLITAECELVTPEKNPGDICASSWDCTTRFCKSGVCANPLPEDSACVEGDLCQGDSRCIDSVCTAPQVDGAACTSGDECISGSCGGGVCVNTTKYSCDGV